ncbi:hypothetical protein [Ascidiimonas sp. W6]|uniref:hypothetical protein n=1 Tax=Ascidiimonas meishanensis TaxID=3128903 RepID=UPI0030EC153F
MKKKILKNLILNKSTISNLNEVKGGDLIPITIIRTQFVGCLSFIGHHTCETGLQPTCDHSYRICPITTEVDC